MLKRNVLAFCRIISFYFLHNSGIQWSGTTEPTEFTWSCCLLTALVCMTRVRDEKNYELKKHDIISFAFTFRMCITFRTVEGLLERTDHLEIFLFPPITQWCSISDVLFTGGRGVPDFNVLIYY